MEKKSVVVVMTARGPERILREGGSQAWVLNPSNAKKHEFLVTVQNRHNGAWGGASEPHGTAFLIGRISDVVPSTEEGSEGRYLIRISEYARINVTCGWKGRNPVRYTTLDELAIELDGIKFLPMPSVKTMEEEMGEEISAECEPVPSAAPDLPTKRTFLTIPEAKEGLAATLGVTIDKIEITIKA